MSLECTINKPDAQSKWLKNGEEIVPSDHYDIVTDGTRHVLTIPEASVDDQAEYTVVIGEKSSTANLRVEGRSRDLF